VFIFLRHLVEAIQPLLVPICFVLAWLFAITLISTIITTLRDTLNRAKQMHEIPCTDCKFFTGDYRLKCTVRPQIANTEQAIGCRDYLSDRVIFSEIDLK
jgi:hypothetical protein